MYAIYYPIVIMKKDMYYYMGIPTLPGNLAPPPISPQKGYYILVVGSPKEPPKSQRSVIPVIDIDPTRTCAD